MTQSVIASTRDKAQLVFPNYTALKSFIDAYLRPLGYVNNITPHHHVLLVARESVYRHDVITRYASSRPTQVGFKDYKPVWVDDLLMDSLACITDPKVAEELIYAF